MQFMKNFKKQFPLLNHTTYLNTAASGLLPETVLEFRQEHDLDFLISGSGIKKQQAEILAATRESTGKLFGCAPNRVALVPNFSYGFNILMEGVEKNQKVLLLRNDYPSVNWAAESRDFNISYAEIDAGLEQNIAEAVKKEQPDIFCFSLVQYINGIKIKPEFLKQLKKENPDLLLFADGTQYCGTEKFDFDASPLDVLGASCYKWLNAGYGNAFFLFKPTMEQQIKPKTLGFDSLEGKYKPHEGSLIGKFEPGHLDSLNFGSLNTALKLVEQIGIEEIQEQIKSLATSAKKELSALGLLEDSVVDRKIHSSIFNLQVGDEVFNHLRSNGILSAKRGAGIRVSFHYFNTADDLQKLLKVLKK